MPGSVANVRHPCAFSVRPFLSAPAVVMDWSDPLVTREAIAFSIALVAATALMIAW